MAPRVDADIQLLAALISGHEEDAAASTHGSVIFPTADREWWGQ